MSSFEGDHIMRPIHNSKERYEPRPLIDDTAVIVHAGRNNDAETSIVSISKTKYLLPPANIKEVVAGDRPGDLDPFDEGAEALVEHMEVITSSNGETTLKVFTCECTGVVGPEAVDAVFMLRHTRFLGPPPKGEKEEGTGQIVCEPVTYVMSFADFNAIRCNDEWMTSLRDVIDRRSDLAVRHVRHRLKYHQVDDTHIKDVPTTWKPRRHPLYRDYEHNVASSIINDISTLSPDEQICYTCQSQYDSLNHTPLVLRCCGKHICRYCYISWSESCGPSATCPHCRAPFYLYPTADRLRWGGIDKTYFSSRYGNDRFNPWENFERMSADLDIEHAENSHDVLKVDSAVLLKAWQTIVQGALLEPASSTPLQMQPARSAEYDLLAHALPILFETYNGMSLPTDILYDNLRRDTATFFYRKFLECEMHVHHGLTHAQLRA